MGSERRCRLIDRLSMVLVEEMERRFKEFKSAMNGAYRQLLESPAGAGLRKDLEGSGITIDQLTSGDGDKDMPFYEGESGTRAFLMMGFREQVARKLDDVGLLSFQHRLAATWFQHGEFSKLTPSLQRQVLRLAQHPRSTPLTLYREQEKDGTDLTVGKSYCPRVPRSWSLVEKPMMGDTTLIVKTTVGTCVAILSPYIGEEEVVSFRPKGYVVTSVNERRWGNHPKSRRVVTLEEA